MNGAWWSLIVLVVLALALVGAAALCDLLPRGSRDVSDEALRRARELDARHQSPGPPSGFFQGY